MKILILGSEGFIGSHCVDQYVRNGWDVYGADLFEQPAKPYAYTKISRLSPELNELFAGTVFDAVINAAGSGNVPYSMTHPLQDFEANSLDTIRVLDAVRKYQPGCRYLHFSSAAVYGNPQRLPIHEEDTLQPVSPYGWHKLIAEQLCREYTTVFGLKTAIVRPFSVYGPGLKKQLFWDLYQKTKAAEGVLELFGSGEESRDYIHVSDVVQASAFILQNGPMAAEAYNLASGKETTIAEVVPVYFKALGVEADYRFNGHRRAGDPINWRADVNRVTALGHINQIGLQEGLQQLASWITKF